MALQYDRHEISGAYPEMTLADGLGELVHSMKVNGYDKRFPIMIYDGAILDGWNRWRAAEIAGVTPAEDHFEGSEEDAVAFVIAHNTARRHVAKGKLAVAVCKTEYQLPPRKRRGIRQLVADLGISESMLKKAFKMVADHPGIAGAILRDEKSWMEGAQDAGYDEPPKTPGGAITCTHPRIIAAVHASLIGIPTLRSRKTEKQAINESGKAGTRGWFAGPFFFVVGFAHEPRTVGATDSCGTKREVGASSTHSVPAAHHHRH